MKNKESWIITYAIPLIVSLAFIMLIVGAAVLENENCDMIEVCYKVECNIWGCHHIEVDLESESCERKKVICRQLR